MPTLDVSEVNIVIAILGAFIIGYGFISVKIKQVWYLGEALPAVIVGIILGPIAARFLDAERWGSAVAGQQEAITLALCRIVIGVQLVIAGFQLPAKYQQANWKEMALCLLPIMTIMWLCTSVCILICIPRMTFLTALVIGSCVTCTDPILSQAVAKGPFADKFVRRELREIISSEAGANDGFGFPFLLLATYLIRHAELANVTFKEGVESAVHLIRRAGEEGASHGVGRLGGGVAKAMEQWFVEGWFYIIAMSMAIGVIIGTASLFAINFGLRRRWIDSESFLLWPAAIGLFTIGACGMLGTDDLLACFVAGNVLNWNGLYLEEAEKRHDEVNSSLDVLLNFGGFMYIGTIIPWSEFHMPDVTGITIGKLFLLGFLVLIFRRLPAIFLLYRFMPRVVQNWKEALFMGYFGPIGIGAVFYIEHARHLFPSPGTALTTEEDSLTSAMGPVVYFLVIFSIIVHGLSIPALDAFYRHRGVSPILEDNPAEIQILSENDPLPANAYVDARRRSVVAHNRFSRPTSVPELYRWRTNESVETLKTIWKEQGLGERQRSFQLEQRRGEGGGEREMEDVQRSKSEACIARPGTSLVWADQLSPMGRGKSFQGYARGSENLEVPESFQGSKRRSEGNGNGNLEVPETSLRWADQDGDVKTPPV
ncbi:Na(+)/H(+) antiporter 1 [Sporormia fimetaria CBS 119925]|uniref:Na(+)/H(+) antiporter 1 n=1 Tax=Sporormia fimetaria CBS 119925 TaxID=1340428 RepID=A0A6A6UWI6_9PLEO|nr:Na(+)/H(+) antiporter 1 [Sporormia fimetaria CBS 119925]